MTVLLSSEVEALVLARAGARPLDRDAVDERIVNDVKTGSGMIINSQNDVPVGPQLSPTSHVLDVPDNPSGDDDGDGYSNVEEWLHSLAVAIEGRYATQ